MSMDTLGWVWLLSKYVLVLVPPAFALWVLRRISAHSLFLYGQRTNGDGDDAVLCYRFALQNNEDIPLRDQTLRIAILDCEGRFVDSPEIYNGLSTGSAATADDRRSWTFRFDELPPFDTWTIDCRMNACARNVVVELPDSTVTLSGSRLCLDAARSSRLTGTTSVEWWWCGLALVLGCIAYGGIVSSNVAKPQVTDALFLAVMAVFTLVLDWAGRVFSPRSAPPVTQGYWEPNRVRGVSRPDDTSDNIALSR